MLPRGPGRRAPQLRARGDVLSTSFDTTAAYLFTTSEGGQRPQLPPTDRPFGAYWFCWSGSRGGLAQGCSGKAGQMADRLGIGSRARVSEISLDAYARCSGAAPGSSATLAWAFRKLSLQAMYMPNDCSSPWCEGARAENLIRPGESSYSVSAAA